VLKLDKQAHTFLYLPRHKASSYLFLSSKRIANVNPGIEDVDLLKSAAENIEEISNEKYPFCC
jgi:hypothetical protein